MSGESNICQDKAEQQSATSKVAILPLFWPSVKRRLHHKLKSLLDDLEHHFHNTVLLITELFFCFGFFSSQRLPQIRCNRETYITKLAATHHFLWGINKE